MTITEIRPAIISVSPRGMRGAPGADGAPGDQINFRSRSAAEAATFTAPQVHLWIAGYYQQGDGGHGLYVRTVSPTGEYFQSADGAYWNLVVHGCTIYIEQCGGKGDGATNNDAAFTRAKGTLPAQGGAIIFGTGVYVVTSLVLDKKLHVKGQGWGVTPGIAATEIRTSTANLDAIDVVDNLCNISDLHVSSTVPAASRTGRGIRLAGQINVVTRVWINGHYDGIGVYAAGCELEDVYSQQNKNNGIVISSDGAFQGAIGAVLRNCQGNSNGAYGVILSAISGGFGAGVQMFNTSGTSNLYAGIVLTGNVNDVYLQQSGGGTNGRYGIDMTSFTGTNVGLSNALAELNEGGAQIYIGAGCHNISINGCTITGGNQAGFGVISGGQNVSIGGCNFGVMQTGAVQYISGSDHSTLFGCTLRPGNLYGVVFTSGAGPLQAAANDFTTASSAPRFGPIPIGSNFAACPGF
jgi:hypothetical protein